MKISQLVNNLSRTVLCTEQTLEEHRNIVVNHHHSLVLVAEAAMKAVEAGAVDEIHLTRLRDVIQNVENIK